MTKHIFEYLNEKKTIFAFFQVDLEGDPEEGEIDFILDKLESFILKTEWTSCNSIEGTGEGSFFISKQDVGDTDQYVRIRAENTIKQFGALFGWNILGSIDLMRII